MNSTQVRFNEDVQDLFRLDQGNDEIRVQFSNFKISSNTIGFQEQIWHFKRIGYKDECFDWWCLLYRVRASEINALKVFCQK